MPKILDKALLARDSKRDIGAELLQSVRDLKAGRWGRKTTIETLPRSLGGRTFGRIDGTLGER